MFSAIIIDDEPVGIETLQILIEKYTNGVKIIGTTTDPEKGVHLIEELKPEIVFLDISMPQLNGFELINRLTYKNFKLVFTTAHQEYALKAIKNRALDYLLKPISVDELRACINHIINDINTTSPSAIKKTTPGFFELSVKDGIVFINPQDIIRLEAAGSYTIFYLENNIKHMASKNIKEYETMLELFDFYRCHSSHIINLRKIVKMLSTDGLYIQMTDGSLPEITKKNKVVFLEKIKKIQL